LPAQGGSNDAYGHGGLAVAIIATQVLGDLVNVVRGDLVRGAIGFTIAGALLFYLLRSEVRAAFAKAAM
jgi:hypothetical protein